MKSSLKPLVLYLSALSPSLAYSQISFSMSGDVAIPIGTMDIGLTFGSSIAIKNVGSSFAQSTLFNWSDLYALYQVAGVTFVPKYVYAFELINDATGYQDSNLFISDYKYLAPNEPDLGTASPADHPFYITFGTGLASQTFTGLANYTLVFRVFDGPCVQSKMHLNYTGLYNECIAYNLYIKSTTIDWTSPTGPSLPPGTVLPMINHRPYDSDPPSTLPNPTFLTCTPDGCN